MFCLFCNLPESENSQVITEGLKIRVGIGRVHT